MSRCACPPDGSFYCPRCAALLARANSSSMPPKVPASQPTAAVRVLGREARVSEQGKPEAFLGHPGGLQADKCEISLVLPWPPSINHYWVHVGTRRVVSTDGRLYRRQAVAAIHSQWPSDVPRPLAGRLAVTLRLYASTRHDYDIDNRIKVTLDCLQRARAMQNDNQIDALHVYRERLTTGGRVDVWLMVC